MSPRPILKTHGTDGGFPSPTSALPFRAPHSPHVHFPPTPTLTDTQNTHSPFVYDRAPIVVSPNRCALPERGGRVYSPFTVGGLASPDPKGSYFHPRAYEADSPEEPNFPDHCFNGITPAPTVFAQLSPDCSDDSDSSLSSSYASPTVSSPIGYSEYHSQPPPSMTKGGAVGPAVIPSMFPLDLDQARIRRSGTKRTSTGPKKKSRLAFERACAGWDNETSFGGCLDGF